VTRQNRTHDPVAPVTVWFDGGCPLCKREIAFFQRLNRDQGVDFSDLRDPQAFCPLTPQSMLDRLHARENGVMLDGAAAFSALWRALPWLRPIGLLARHRPVLWMLERLYRGFLKIRPRLQRMVSSRG
jgi:predicted DCC family thiol-disulfide oxidoreductase YuxK